jgi:hypothetical protein
MVGNCISKRLQPHFLRLIPPPPPLFASFPRRSFVAPNPLLPWSDTRSVLVHPDVDRETRTKRTTSTIRLRANKSITMASPLYADSPASSTATLLDKIEQRWNLNEKRHDYTYHYDLTQIDNDSIDESVVIME